MRFLDLVFTILAGRLVRLPGLWGVVGNLEGDELVLIRNHQFKIISMFDIIGIRLSTLF